MSKEHAGTRQFVDLGDRRLSYLEWGSSNQTPVVLLHGWNGAAWTWERVGAALAEQYRVLALDARGQGHSDWHRQVDYSYQSMVDDLKRFVDELGLKQLALVGHSMGALHAVPFAAQYPGDAAALVLVDAGPRPQRDVEATAADFWKIPLDFASWDMALEYLRARVPPGTALGPSQFERRAEEAFVRRIDGRVGWRADIAGLQQKRREYDPLMVDEGQWPAVKAIRCPTLLLLGGRSTVLGPDIARQMTEANPRIQLRVFPNAAHSIHTDDFDGFMGVVRPFLTDVLRVDSRSGR